MSLDLTATFQVLASGVEACINVSIIDDNNYEGIHSFSVRLVDGSQDPNSLTIGSNDSMIITITDEDGEIYNR